MNSNPQEPYQPENPLPFDQNRIDQFEQGQPPQQAQPPRPAPETAPQAQPVAPKDESHQLDSTRQTTENTIDQAIDKFGNIIPGGKNVTKQAKEAVGGILDKLEAEGERRLGDLGKLFGGGKKEEKPEE